MSVNNVRFGQFSGNMGIKPKKEAKEAEKEIKEHKVEVKPEERKDPSEVLRAMELKANVPFGSSVDATIARAEASATPAVKSRIEEMMARFEEEVERNIGAIQTEFTGLSDSAAKKLALDMMI